MPLPAVHVLGAADEHYASGRKLVACFESSVFEHPGGHETAKDPAQNAAIAKKLRFLTGHA